MKPLNKPEIKNKYNVSSKSSVSVTTQLKRTAAELIPIVLYSPRAYQKIAQVVAMCDKEVGWFGSVEVKGINYLITDIFVPEQEVSSIETNISPSSHLDLIVTLDNPDSLYYWGHSHVNMAVAPSLQDEDQVEEYLNHAPVFIRGIYNKKGDSKVDVYDTKQGVIFEKVLDRPFISGMTAAELKTFKAAVKANVIEPPVSNYYGNGAINRTYNGTRTYPIRSKVNPFIRAKA